MKNAEAIRELQNKNGAAFDLFLSQKMERHLYLVETIITEDAWDESCSSTKIDYDDNLSVNAMFEHFEKYPKECDEFKRILRSEGFKIRKTKTTLIIAW